MNHQLKCWPEQFAAIDCGVKTFEFRSEGDRQFSVGDNLELMEYRPASREFTGEHMVVHVRHLVRGPLFGIPEGFVCMSITKVTP